MTENARRLLAIHAKTPDQGKFAMGEAGLTRDAAIIAYRELHEAGMVEAGNGMASVGSDIFPLFRPTQCGLKAAAGHSR